MKRNKKIKVTQNDLTGAFAEWDRRYREEPEKFENEVEHLLKSNPLSYGERSAVYFMSIIKEQAEAGQ